MSRRFKGVGVLDVSPELCFKYCDPKPDGKRVKWDKAIRELEVIEYLRKDDPVSCLLNFQNTTSYKQVKVVIDNAHQK